MQTFISHSLCFSSMCVRDSRSFTAHSGNHAVNDSETGLDYTLGWDLLTWDLKGRVCFGSLVKIFVPIHRSALSFSCICSVLSYTPPTVDIFLFIHFYIFPLWGLAYSYFLFTSSLHLLNTFFFVFIYEFNFLIMILIVSIIYSNIFVW